MNSTLPIAEGTNAHFQYEVTTSAPTTAVWRLWSDVSTWPSWDTELETARLDGAFASGVTGVLKGKGAPESAFSIADVVDGQRYAVVTKLPLGGTLVIERFFVSTEGGTRFRHEVRFEGFGGRLLSAFLGRGYREALPGAMERLRALAEGAR